MITFQDCRFIIINLRSSAKNVLTLRLHMRPQTVSCILYRPKQLGYGIGLHVAYIVHNAHYG